MKLRSLVKQRKEQMEERFSKTANNVEAIEVEDRQVEVGKSEDPPETKEPAPKKEKPRKKELERDPDECDPPKKLVQSNNVERRKIAMSKLYGLSMKYIEETPPECRKCPSSDNTRSTVSTSSGSLGKSKPRRFLTSSEEKKPTFITRLFDCTASDGGCGSMVCVHNGCGAYGSRAKKEEQATRSMAFEQKYTDTRPSQIVTKSMPVPAQKQRDHKEDEDDHESLNMALAELADKIEKVKTQDDPPDVLLDEIAELEKLVASIEQGHPELKKKKQLESSANERREDYPFDQLRQLNMQREQNAKVDDASTISTHMSLLQESDPVEFESGKAVLGLEEEEKNEQS